MENEVKTIIDRWLSVLPEISCFPQVMRVYAPTCQGQCEDLVDKLADKITNIFGGSSTYGRVRGCWFDEDVGENICEPIKVIEVGHQCSNKEELEQLKEAIVDYAVNTRQKYMSIKNGRFYLAETPKLAEAYEKLTAELP